MVYYFIYIFRLFQNFFAGIEYINSTAYLIENSNKDNLGYFSSLAALGISGGYLFASVTVLIVSILIKKNYLPEWGWRFVFLISIFGIILGFWIRKKIPESITFIVHSNGEKNKSCKILLNSFCYIIKNKLQCLSISLLTLVGVFLTYIYYIYIPINLISNRNFSQLKIYNLHVINLFIIVLLIPLFGKLSDYLDRIKMLKFTCGIVLILAFPFFWLYSYGSNIEIILISILMSIPAACFFSLYPFFITNCFPPGIRCTTASLIYQIIVSIEMGTLPLINNYLVHSTHISYIPAYLFMFVILLGYSGLIYLKYQPNSIKYEV